MFFGANKLIVGSGFANGLTFNKNNKANLLNLCEKCHDEIHKTNKKYKKTKATIGIILEEI